jgi:hypothetical protein
MSTYAHIRACLRPYSSAKKKRCELEIDTHIFFFFVFFLLFIPSYNTFKMLILLHTSLIITRNSWLNNFFALSSTTCFCLYTTDSEKNQRLNTRKRCSAVPSITIYLNMNQTTNELIHKKKYYLWIENMSLTD